MFWLPWRGFAEDGTEFSFELETPLSYGDAFHHPKKSG
jgi:hypothetical protein